MAATVQERTARARGIVSAMRVDQPDVPRPPGPSGALSMLRMSTGRVAPHEFFASLRSWHQPVVHVGLGGEHVHVLFDPEAIWDVFVTHGRNTRKSLGLQMTRPLLGEGLLTADGPTHMRHRRAIQPMFHKRRIDGYVRDMVDAAGTTSEAWTDGDEFDIGDAMSELTLDIIGRTIFGVDLRGEASDVAEALGTVLAGFARGLGPLASPLSLVPTKRRAREIAAIEHLDEIVAEMIAQRADAVDRGESGDDLLTMLLTASDEEGGPAFSPEEVRDEAMTLVLAGHETTALALTWAWVRLAARPRALAWLREELDALPSRPIVADDLPELPRTHAVVAEAMRLHPPAWIIGRWLEQDLRIAAWDLPRGSVVLASQYAMHRDARFWAAPDQFVPQRWITGTGAFDERAPRVPRGVWFPFGFGARRCIGEQFAWTEAVAVLASLARDWDIAVDADAEPPMMAAITLRPAVPLPTVVRRRR